MQMTDFKPLEDLIKNNTKYNAIEIISVKKLTGGAIQENLEVIAKNNDESLHWVLRRDAQSQLLESMDRHNEYDLMFMLYEQGIKVPEPIFKGTLDDKPFYIMSFISGVTEGHLLVNPEKTDFDRKHVVSQLAQQLQLIHNIRPNHLSNIQLESFSERPALSRLLQLEKELLSLDNEYPTLLYTIEFLKNNMPPQEETVLTHRDFRTGNFKISNSLNAVLDWEFCGWSEFYEDLGWFCAPCWRFKHYDNEAGGLSTRDYFVSEYEKFSGKTVNLTTLDYWQIYGMFRWGMIALQQARRHHNNEERSIELLLTEYLIYEINDMLIYSMENYNA
jgi:aminoglycoside phosphotransferase (APT) family kinase protein